MVSAGSATPPDTDVGECTPDGMPEDDRRPSGTPTGVQIGATHHPVAARPSALATGYSPQRLRRSSARLISAQPLSRVSE